MNLRLKTHYPDSSIYCKPNLMFERAATISQEPTVVMQNLLETTMDYNRGRKSKLYRAIPSQREYILVDSEAIGIDSFRLNSANHRGLEEYKAIDRQLFISALGITVSLRTIYEHTNLI